MNRNNEVRENKEYGGYEVAVVDSSAEYISIKESFYCVSKEWQMTNDILFKYIFGRDLEESKILLMDLINCVMKLREEERIVDITYNNPFNLQEYVKDKLSVTDIKVTAKSGIRYNVEMQVAQQDHYIARSIFYWSELYSKVLSEGEEYEKLKRTVSIHFLEHILFGEWDQAHHKVTMKNQDNQIVTDLLEMHYIQMPLVDDIIKENKELSDWIMLMRDISNPAKRNEVEQIINGKEVMKVAFKQFEKATADEILREKMAQELKARRDRNAEMSFAKREAREKGLKEGIEQGRANAIINMYEAGFDDGQIAEVMKSTVKEVRRIINDNIL